LLKIAARNLPDRSVYIRPAVDENRTTSGDSKAILAWKARMIGVSGKDIYEERASTGERGSAMPSRAPGR